VHKGFDHIRDLDAGVFKRTGNRHLISETEENPPEQDGGGQADALENGVSVHFSPLPKQLIETIDDNLFYP
jgi:hypothetical protein